MMTRYHEKSSKQKRETFDAQRGQLHKKVKELFEVSHDRQRTQVEALRKRLAEMEQRLQQRGKQKADLIESRVADLLSDGGWKRELVQLEAIRLGQRDLVILDDPDDDFSDSGGNADDLFDGGDDLFDNNRSESSGGLE